MNKYEKRILGLSAVAAVATPVVAVVSCGKSTIIKKTVTEIRTKKWGSITRFW